jgi:Flp pilus assembly protein TadD
MSGHTTSENDLSSTNAPEALVASAGTLVSQRRFGKAIECLDRALEQHPDATEWIRLRGNVLQIVARHEEALRDFQSLIARTPSDGRAWQKLAHSLRSLDRPEEAEKAFLRAIELDPRSVDSMADLGNLCRDAGRYREAVEWLSKAVAGAPSDSGLRAMLGAALLTADDPGGARQNLEKAFQLNPYDRTALAYLYVALCQTGDKEIASGLIQPDLLVRSYQRAGSAGGSGNPDDLDDRLADHVRGHPGLEFGRRTYRQPARRGAGRGPRASGVDRRSGARVSARPAGGRFPSLPGVET